ncbi:LiaF-related protein [Rhodococcus antarcticus]|uniref:LiaF-related protein n=1 Tax=Rhodococcus antarcticus TaxID=2987751 RepID=A0ABY6NYK0_9NOCA|nr:LiaF domain-containing protein [Rhodococcus antarcticus]UZJ24363.1 LiaF-related protein [Rhodococcus antarcticus]
MDEAAGTDGGADRAVGDLERAVADAELQAAVGRGALSLRDYEDLASSVWGARTRGELAAVVADLVTSPEPSVVPATPTTREPLRTVAVMSESQFSGAVLPGQPVQATAVMGTVVVDLRRTDLPHDVQVRAVTVMGEVTVLVPRGVQVHLSGAAVMGSRTTDVGPAEPGAPVVTVRASALMGSVTVSHGSGEQVAVPGVDLEKGRGTVDRRRPHRSGGWPLKRIVTVVAVAAAAYGAVQVAGADHTTVFGSGTVTQTGPGTVDVGVLFGSEVVVVPDNAVVSTEGGMVFGSTTCDAACVPGRTGGPAITVKGAGAFGRVQVRTASEAAADRSHR